VVFAPPLDVVGLPVVGPALVCPVLLVAPPPPVVVFVVVVVPPGPVVVVMPPVVVVVGDPVVLLLVVFGPGPVAESELSDLESLEHALAAATMASNTGELRKKVRNPLTATIVLLRSMPKPNRPMLTGLLESHHDHSWWLLCRKSDHIEA